MNKVIIAFLNIIGALNILGGFILGFTTYKIEVPGVLYSTTEENYSILFMWIGAGIISGLIMFGFAAVINLLEEKRDFSEKQVDVLKDLNNQLTILKDSIVNSKNPSQKTTQVDQTQELRKISSGEDIKKIRKELREKGYDNDFIEATIAQKRQDK